MSRAARKQKYKLLESQTKWRLIKVTYIALSCVWFLVAILIEAYDKYDETDTGALVFFGVCSLLLYPLFKRIVAYIFLGKTDKSAQKHDIV